MSVASIRNLTVRYGQFTALNDFTVEVPEGCTGLLGPNGAGKTTLLKTLLGFVQPAAGSGTVLGADITTQGREIRQRVGFMPEQDCHIPGMTAVQYVAFAGELAGMPARHAMEQAHKVLQHCGLGEARYRNVETYSTGMKQRIKLAQAIVHGPKLLLLDEPTNGLDPRGREDMLQLIRSVSHGRGLNVLLSSHLLPDIERVCDQVIVVQRGHLQAQSSIDSLKSLQGRPIDVELREASGAFVIGITARGATLLNAKLSTYRIQAPGTPEEIGRMAMEVARETGAQVRGYHIAERSLEDAFLEALQRPEPVR